MDGLVGGRDKGEGKKRGAASPHSFVNGKLNNQQANFLRARTVVGREYLSSV